MVDMGGKVIIVTGAAGALGSATAVAFHAAGASLALIDREHEIVRSVFGSTIPEGPDCYYAATNLMDEQAVAETIESIWNYFGRIDALINIAGGFTEGPPLHETPVETWQFMMDLNARTVFLTCRATIPHFLQQHHGKIINIGARAALAGKANMAPYTASKSAVIRLTESMAQELRHDNINVNCVLPGKIDTPRNRRDAPDADFATWVPPEAIADVLIFLVSDASRAINGASIPVYGRS
jgi:NAD(P)-dependent dehydrogenase (short-subunit alcohol dehydrogenase family)